MGHLPSLVDDPPPHHFAPFGAHQVGDRFQGGAFTRAVGAQQHHDLPFCDLQRHAAHGQDGLFVEDFNIVDLQDRHVRRHASFAFSGSGRTHAPGRRDASGFLAAITRRNAFSRAY